MSDTIFSRAIEIIEEASAERQEGIVKEVRAMLGEDKVLDGTYAVQQWAALLAQQDLIDTIKRKERLFTSRTPRG